MRRTGGIGAPTAFSVLSSWIFGAVSVVIEFLLDLDALGEELVFTLAMTGAMLMFLPVLVVFSLALTAVLHHGMLWILRGARFPFETTYRVVAYATGCAAAFAMIPGSWGSLASAVAQVVFTIVGLAKAQEISTAKSLAAVLLPILLCIAAVVFAVWQLDRAGLLEMLESME
jgi:hypothetical protein